MLKTLSAEIKRCLNNDVPQDQPGLISYDSYWEFLQGNAVLRSVPEIRDVIDVSKVVENRIQQAFTRKALQPMAERIIHGLSIHRLTTDDIRAKIGPTAEELQNDLCLIAPIPEKTSDFLRTTVEACLKEIMKTVNLYASNLKQPTEDVLRWLAGGVKNNLATAVLDGLELLDGDKLQKHLYESVTEYVRLGYNQAMRENRQYLGYDLPWNPMRIEQRIGRVDRIGQKLPVKAFNLIFEDSVELRVQEVLEEKLATILEAVREAIGNSPKSRISQ